MKTTKITSHKIISDASAATVGFFDGVHRGHRFLIEQLKTKAAADGLPTSVVTFSQHPKKILQSEQPIELLTSFDERIALLASLGIDYCYVVDFTEDFSKLSAENFIQHFLSKQLNIKLLLIGYDHKFGKGRSAGFEDYCEYGKRCGMKVERAEALCDKDLTFSSSAIRRFLRVGKVAEAAAMLSYPYSFECVVVSGDRIGRTIGFPTANLKLTDSEKMLPMQGVYSVFIRLKSDVYRGMLYIGTRPTLSGKNELRIEVNIFDFDEEIYGERLQVGLLDFVRTDLHFNSLEDLKRQLEKDREYCLEKY